MSETPEHQPTLMLVDDTPENLRLLSRALQRKGYRIMAFANGMSALRALEKKTPDLILLDVNMPEIDGYEVCQRIKGQESTAEIPILFISALQDTEMKSKAFLVGGQDYITKPFKLEEVYARVHTHLQLSMLQRERLEKNKTLEEEIQRKLQELTEAQMSTIVALARLAENRDDETGKHVERVGRFTLELAKSYEKNHDPNWLTGQQQTHMSLFYASSLHDIGKVGIEDSILLKPGKLTREEFERMKQHTVIGYETLKKVHDVYPSNKMLKLALPIARSHHERWDGGGYPDKLKGNEIPLCAQMLALADVYDALRSKRSYKDAFSHQQAKSILIESSGGHFNPLLIELFLEEEESWNAIWDELS